MKITDVLAIPVSIPLTRPYRIARGVVHQFSSVIVRISTDNGLSGYGESVPLSVVGDVKPILKRIGTHGAEVLLGRDPLDIEDLNAEVLAAVDNDLDSLAAIDCALWDLIGKKLEMPVFRLMGGACNNPILVDYTLGSEEPALMADTASQMIATGYKGVVVKVIGDMAKDVERVAAVRARVGQEVNIRVDCNTGYKLEDALPFLDRLKPFNVEFVEQPVAARDLAGMRKCREVGISISADESLDSLPDALNLISESACDLFNIKIPKVGGLTSAKKIAAVAAAADMPIVVGGRTTLELSRHASRHFAASTPLTRGRAHEGPGPASQALCDDIVAVRSTRFGLKSTRGCVAVETTPGLGAEILTSKLEKYRLPQ